MTDIDLNKCPNCDGPADNGHDRCVPPSPYVCTVCEARQETFLAAKRIIDNSPSYCVPHANSQIEIEGELLEDQDTYILIDWSKPGVGFGQAYIYWRRTDDKVCLQSEGMGKEFVKEMLCQLIDDAELVE